MFLFLSKMCAACPSTTALLSWSLVVMATLGHLVWAKQAEELVSDSFLISPWLSYLQVLLFHHSFTLVTQFHKTVLLSPVVSS